MNITRQGLFKNIHFFEPNVIKLGDSTLHVENPSIRYHWQTQLSFSTNAKVSYHNSRKTIENANTPKFELCNTLSYTTGLFGNIDVTAQHTFRIRQLFMFYKINMGTFYGKEPTSP
jgi:hypothetical protein